MSRRDFVKASGPGAGGTVIPQAFIPLGFTILTPCHGPTPVGGESESKESPRSLEV